MTPFPVVKHLDVFEGVGRGLGPRRVAGTVDSLVLETVEPALRRRVVPAIAFAAHRAGHAVVGKLVLEHPAGVLAAAVRVVQHARRRLPAGAAGAGSVPFQQCGRGVSSNIPTAIVVRVPRAAIDLSGVARRLVTFSCLPKRK